MCKKNGYLVYAFTVALVASAGAAYAVDDMDEDGAQQINGDYRVVITQTCVRTPFQLPPANGFDPDTRQLLAEGETLSAIGSGLLRFNGDGSVQLLEGAQTEVSLNPTAAGKTPITAPVQFTCSGTYTMDQRKVALSLSCDIQQPQPGVTVKLEPQNFEGYMDKGKQTLNLTNIAGGVQTITVSVAGMAVQQRQRICTQHGLAMK